MACELKQTCNFLLRFFWCTLPKDTIHGELTVRMFKGIHTFREDHSTESAPCSSWSRQMKHFPLLKKKKEAFKEERRDEDSPFHPSPIKVTKKATPQNYPEADPIEKVNPNQGSWTWDVFPNSRQRGCIFVGPIARITMAINTQITTPSLPAAKTCKKGK